MLLCHPEEHLHNTFGACPEGQAGSTTGFCQGQGFSKYDLGAPWEVPRGNGHIIKPTQLYDPNVAGAVVLWTQLRCISQPSLPPRSSALDFAANADLKTHIKYITIPLFPVTHADDSINFKTAVKFNFTINPANPGKHQLGRRQPLARVWMDRRGGRRATG